MDTNLDKGSDKQFRGDGWMFDNYEYFEDLPINHIIAPGTHNSGTYKINLDKSIETVDDFSGYTLFNKLGRHFGCVKNIISDWTKTQNLSIIDQLKMGIRCIDFRISYNNIDFKLYVTHTFTCIPFEDCLQQIYDFIEYHPGEIVFIRLKPDYQHQSTITPLINDQITQLIREKLGKHLLKQLNHFPTYKNCLESKHRVILFSEIESKFFWNLDRVVNEWPNSNDVDYTLDKLESSLQRMDYSKSKYNTISFILTPQSNNVKDDIVKRIFVRKYDKNSIKKMTQDIQEMADDFYEEHKDELYKLSCIATDFPTTDFIEKIVNLNFI